MSKKVLGPPKGAAETAETARQTVLRGRFSDEGDGTTEAGTPAAEGRTPASHTSHTRVQPAKRRAEPEGMTRRTYYLPQAAAAALDEAVATIRAATGDRVSKHEALALLITAGAERADELAEEARAALLRELQGGAGTSPGSRTRIADQDTGQ